MKPNLIVLEGIRGKEFEHFNSKLILPATSLVVAGFHISNFVKNMLEAKKNSINYATQEKMLQRIYNCHLIYLVSEKNKEVKKEKWFELGYNLSCFKKVIISLDYGSSSYYNNLINSFIKNGVVIIEEKMKLVIRQWKDELDQNVGVDIYEGIRYWRGEKNERK